MQLLPSHLIPQADDPQRLVALARHVAQHGASSLPDDFKTTRDLAYYRNALRVLGWADEHGIPTEAASGLPAADAEVRAVFLRSLEASELGRRWLHHGSVSTLAEAQPDSIDAFLAAHTNIKQHKRED